MRLFQTSQKTLPASIVVSLLLVMLLSMALSCQKESNQTTRLKPYIIELPNSFPRLEIPDDNQPYMERIALGRKLYYDSTLSNDGRACASCHIQAQGFTKSSQNVMPVLHHANLAWKNLYMWDGSQSGSLEELMYFEVTEFFNTNLSKFNSHPEYPALFKEAYNSSTITGEDLAKALAQFVRTLISANSKYDQVMSGQATFTELEAKGHAIFTGERGSCYHCHIPPLFTDNRVHNIGLDSTYEIPANQGYFHSTGDSSHLGHMRTANLRNIGLRSSFMHDGRFNDLKQVLEHYSNGVKQSPSLDPVMIKSNGSAKLHFTTEEIEALEAFLKTLTDSTFISNPELSQA